MASSESLPTLSDATKAAIEQAVESALEAALPRVINDIKKQLQPETYQPQAKNPPGKAPARRQQEVPILEAQVQSKQIPPMFSKIDSEIWMAQLLKMDESTPKSEVLDWQFSSIHVKHPRKYFKIGSCGTMEFALFLDTHSRRLQVDDEGHENSYTAPGNDSDSYLCLCRVTENCLFSHSKACPDHTSQTSFNNDIGRFFGVGNILCKRTNDESWVEIKVPFALVKSLTEGGLWIIALDWLPTYPETDNDQGNRTFLEPQLRKRYLEGVGEITYARLPDNIFSNFSEVLKSGGYQTESDECVVHEGQFDFQQQYTGGDPVDNRIVMSGSESWDLWGTQGKWEDPSLHIINFPSLHIINFPPDEPNTKQSHFDKWFSGIAGKNPQLALTHNLELIEESIIQFGGNVDDALKALTGESETESQVRSSDSEMETKPCSQPNWQLRLGPLLGCVIKQHLNLFRRFFDWVKKKLKIHEQIKLDQVVALGDLMEARLCHSAFHPDVLSTEHPELHRAFEFVRDKWVCRSVLEITLLILRCHYNSRRPSHEFGYMRRMEREKQSLKGFLETLTTTKSCKKGDTMEDNIACVPNVICFDETSQAIGATRPAWVKEGKYKESWDPWRFNNSANFFTATRDFRIPPEIRKYHFEPAAQLFDELAIHMRDKLFNSTEEARKRREEFHSAFGRKYFGPLRQYELHVWQAVDGKTFDCKTQCVRCQIYWNATLVKPNGVALSTIDTQSSHRIDACAESCLHAELATRLRSRSKAENSLAV